MPRRPSPQPRPRLRPQLRPGLRVRLRVIVGLALLPALIAGPAWAYWRSSQPVAGQSFTLGTLDVQVSGTQPPTAPAFADNVADVTPFDTSRMFPGATYAAIVTVRNNGNIAMSYWLSVQDTHAAPRLAGALTTTVVQGASVSGTAPSATCGAGTSLAAAQTVTASDVVLNNMGTNPAGRRPLAPNGTESLCVALALPLGASSSLQGATSTVTYTVHAEQVAQP